MEAYERLEQQLQRSTGMEHIVACSSGTSALHLAVETLRLPKNAKVAVPDFAMIACARAVSMAGCKPHFVDCNDEDLNISARHLRLDLLTYIDIQAVLAVHTYGRQCDMNGIHEAAKVITEHPIPVIEDMAELHGVSPHDETEIACWSFYKNKVIHGEEGGAVGFRDPFKAGLARSLRSQGFTEAHDFNHLPRGCNYRMANLLAYPIIDSLNQLDQNIQERRRLEILYDNHCPQQFRMPSRDVVWVYDFRIPNLTLAMMDKIIRTLNEQGLPARHSFKPLSLQPEYARKSKVINAKAIHLQSFAASREVMYLPVRPGIDTINTAMNAFGIIKHLIDTDPEFKDLPK